LSDHKVVIRERRDTSPLGVARRKRVEDSLDLLRALGLSRGTIERYRRLARRKRKLPHELVCAVIEQIGIITSGSRYYTRATTLLNLRARL